MKKVSESEAKFLPPGHQKIGELLAESQYFVSVMKKLPDGREEYSKPYLERLIGLARNGDRAAHRATKSIAAKFIQEGLGMPDDLKDYVVKDLRSSETKPRPPGKDPYGNGYRDWCITYAVLDVMLNAVKRGEWIAFTRNRASKEKDSVCSMVAKALATQGVHLSESQVEKAAREQMRRLGVPPPIARPTKKTRQ